uniref:Metallophosphoesterase n=1 Tax=Cyanothece sp. (strain PCC 7425 / ATCC 29141) TaxID=395961 RepID=B8HLS9_CYAP4
MESSEGRRIFIGDVHGHYDGLMRLLETIAPGQGDQIFFLGDLIDRGPASSQVVEFVKNSAYPCILGNHELMMLSAFPQQSEHTLHLLSWLSSGGRETIAGYTSRDLFLEHMEWMQTLPYFLDLGDIWLVHAGVEPTLPLAEQTTEEFCWIRSNFHRSDRPFFADKTIVTGHTITFTLPGVEPGQVAVGSGWMDIDTGAYHPKSGWLTGLDWTAQTVYQTNIFSGKTRTRPLAEATTPIQWLSS